MREIKEHKAYELLEKKYDRVAVDYVILSVDTPYEGLETHKKAVMEAFRILSAGNDAECGEENKITVEAEKMKAVPIGMEELLQLPDDAHHAARPKGSRSFSMPEPIPYWFAFLEPPQGTPYRKADLAAFNDVLFPHKDRCEAYRWNDDFSDYFDAGKEWWGTGLWTVFDSAAGTLIVIGASLTD